MVQEVHAMLLHHNLQGFCILLDIPMDRAFAESSSIMVSRLGGPPFRSYVGTVRRAPLRWGLASDPQSKAKQAENRPQCI